MFISIASETKARDIHDIVVSKRVAPSCHATLITVVVVACAGVDKE